MGLTGSNVERGHAAPGGLLWPPSLLSFVLFPCLLSEAAHSVLGCLTGVIVTCVSVYLVLLVGGCEFGLLLCCRHLGPLPILPTLFS